MVIEKEAKDSAALIRGYEGSNGRLNYHAECDEKLLDFGGVYPSVNWQGDGLAYCQIYRQAMALISLFSFPVPPL